MKNDKAVAKEGIIYRYTLQVECPQKGWSYIGATLDEKARKRCWNNESNKTYGGKKINEARKQYGVKDWAYEVIETVRANPGESIKEKLDEREGFWIKELDSIEHGFNTSDEGTGLHGVMFDEARRKQNGDNRRGKPQPESAREKISKALKGRKVSEETRAKISAGNKGKKRTEEQRKAMSESRKGKEPTQASEGLRRYIEGHGHGPTKGVRMSDEALAKNRESHKKFCKPVEATFPDGHKEQYESLSAAAKACGVGAGSVHSAIRTGGQTRNNLKFNYL